MIAPHSRLLFWTGWLVVPSLAVLGSGSHWTGYVGLVLALFCGVVFCDALLAPRALAGIRILLPDVVRLSKDRLGQIDIRIHNDHERSRRVRLGLMLPMELRSPEEEILADLLPGNPVSQLSWPCIPSRRGKYILRRCYLEGVSPLQFWSWRRADLCSAEIRVYPDLRKDRKNLASLFLNRAAFGVHAQRQIGQGREFEKLREYIPGDGFDEIHWKATAKRNHPVTKVFQIERTQEVYLVIDASRLSGRGAESQAGRESNFTSIRHPRLESFVSSALILGQVAQKHGDAFGLITFSDRLHSFLRAKTGKAHYNGCREALYTLQPRLVTPDFEELFCFIRLRLRRRALIVILTDLDDPPLAESFTRNVNLIARQHLVLVQTICPESVGPVFSADKVRSLDDIYQRLAGHLQWDALRGLEQKLKQRGIQFSLSVPGRFLPELVGRYMSIKQRQLI